VAFVDYDNDGWTDIFLVNGSKLEGAPATASNRLYRNLGAGKFTDVTAAAGLIRSGWGGRRVCGRLRQRRPYRLFVTYWGPNALYRNTGKGGFEDVTAKAGVAGPLKDWSSGCTFLDYDRDGYLDLFVASYQDFDLATAPQPGKGATANGRVCRFFAGRAACHTDTPGCIAIAAMEPSKM